MSYPATMGPLLKVRKSDRRDLSEIDALLARSYPVLLKNHYLPSILVTAIPHISKAQPRLLSSGTYFVVENKAGNIVGAGGWTAVAPGTGRVAAPKTGHIRHVVTDHRVTRSGIGRMLMDQVFASARAGGMEQLDCLSTLMAVPFYAACGFHEVGPVSVNLQPGIDFPAIAMRCKL